MKIFRNSDNNGLEILEFRYKYYMCWILHFDQIVYYFFLVFLALDIFRFIALIGQFLYKRFLLKK